MEEKDLRVLVAADPKDIQGLEVLEVVETRDDTQVLSKQEEQEVVGFTNRMYKKMTKLMGYKDTSPEVKDDGAAIERDALIVNSSDPQAKKDSAMTRMYDALARQSKRLND